MVAAISDLEPAMRELSDIDLAAKTIEFKERIAQGAPLDDLLIEAFAVVREAGRRVLNMRHFDVQLIGGMVLHHGKIAEMKTGEGKTLVATLPCYLNALAGKGVHVVTVNDYLAKRDSEWMGRIYKFLGLRVGVIVHDLDDQERKAAYGADITYGTNNEFGFDYLRDNMKFRLEDCVQRAVQLRHRRRSGLHPHRRSPHPAHHLRPERGIHRQVLQDQPHHPQAGARRGDRGQGAGRKVHHRRLHHRRKAQSRRPHRRGRRSRSRSCSASATCTTPTTSKWQPPRAAGPARARALPARQGLRGQGRRRRARSDHRRRVHRPPDARPALVRRSAPGRGSQGRRQDPAREPDAGHHHLPELLPHVQEAGRHDRYGGNRSGRVPEDLQPRRHRDPHQPATDPQGISGRRLPHRGREVPQRRQGNQGLQRQRASPCWWAPSRSRNPRSSPASSSGWASGTKC